MSRVRFRNAITGAELQLNRHVCTKVRDNTTVEWYFRYIAELFERPRSFIRLLVTGVDGDSRVITYRARSHTLLTCLQQETDGSIWVDVLTLPAPSDYSQAACAGLCVCNFGGCCRRCSDPYSLRCCGSNACCHTGECGHKCCETDLLVATSVV